ncbi:glycosyltransferase, MGT family [Pelosinus propionicus DSM 13327]|uniref:Glycosyltransferase, MGT family n=2 Tax=Pelosinus TaxID=365348 RepID=A0A1I4K7J3_9FIRM|nr:glycosyltransferase, MGT family [Pelosinus propionicus DSM 13327]
MGTGTIMGQTMRVVAIAKALQRRGHEVKFLASGKLIPIIKNFGIDVIEIADMPEFDTFGNQANDLRHKEEHFNKMEQLIARIGEIETNAAAREQPDLLLCGTISGPKTGKSLGIPSLLVALQAHGAKTLAMFAQRLQGIKNQLFRPQEAADLIIIEGMPEISGGVSFEDHWENYETLKEKIYFTGPLLNESPNEMPLRETLKEKHIGAGNKTMVYVTIGGGSSLIGEQFLQLVLESLKMLPWLTGVVSTGIAISPDKIKSFNPPNNVVIRGFVPGTEMIKASDVTVFHGGSSTLMTCVACGTPAVVIPSMAEQEDNAAVLAQSGAGIVLDKKTMTPQMLADAVQAIVTDPGYREQAQKLKSLGEKYGGAEAAASLAEKFVAQKAVIQ